MDFDAIQTALKALVAALSEIDVVQFENEPRKRHNGAIVLLSWVSSDDVGHDERRWEFTADAAPLPNAEPITVGQRTLSVQISVEVHDQRAAAPHARATIEQIRLRMRRASSLAALRAVNVGIADVGAAIQSDYRVDQRMVSRCLFELSLNATEFDRDTAGMTSTIETIELTSHIENPAGDELPVPPNFLNEVMP